MEAPRGQEGLSEVSGHPGLAETRRGKPSGQAMGAAVSKGVLIK